MLVFVSDSLLCLCFPWLLSPFGKISENVLLEFEYPNWLEQGWEWEQHYLYVRSWYSHSLFLPWLGLLMHSVHYKFTRQVSCRKSLI